MGQAGALRVNDLPSQPRAQRRGLPAPCIYVKQLGKETASLALTKG